MTVMICTELYFAPKYTSNNRYQPDLTTNLNLQVKNGPLLDGKDIGSETLLLH